MAEWIYRGVLVLCVAFLAFCAGSFLMLAKQPPYGFFRDVRTAALALVQQQRQPAQAALTDLYGDSLVGGSGVTVRDSTRMQPGYTLYTSGHEPSAYLIDQFGRIVHKWHLPYSEVWRSGGAIEAPVPDTHTYFRYARVLADGDLLVVYDGVGDTPHGYGVVRMDRASKPRWTYLERAHHALDVLPDGRIVTMIHAINHAPIPRAGYLRPPRIDDALVVLSAEGEEQQRIELLPAFVNSPFEGMLGLLPFYLLEGSGDFLHANDVEAVTASWAAASPHGEVGQVMVSMREPGVLALIDLASETMTWALRGPWIGQHDPDLLPNGHVLLYDNGGWFGPGGRSRILEIDPQTQAHAWQYTGTSDAPFHSAIRGVQQRLANGNTLITETQRGRLLEVTPSGDIVWEYLNPARATTERGERIAIISAGTRVGIHAFDAAFAGQLETSSGG
ncbi:MAG: arylsulfotransferase family protein [Pseudomonadota bacterium]